MTDETKSDYDIRREQEISLNKAATLKLERVIKKLGFKLEQLKEDKWFGCAMANGTKEQARISLRANHHLFKNKIEVMGFYPRTAKGDYIEPKNKGLAIGISLNKTEEQIVKDIQNRFIPTYNNNLIEVIAKKQEIDSLESNKLEFMKTLAKDLKLSLPKQEHSNSSLNLSSWNFKQGIENFELKPNYRCNEFTIEMRLDKERLESFKLWLNSQPQGVKE